MPCSMQGFFFGRGFPCGAFPHVFTDVSGKENRCPSQVSLSFTTAVIIDID